MVENESINNAAPISTDPYQPDAPSSDVESAVVETAESQTDVGSERSASAGQARLVLKRGGVESAEVFPFNSPAVIGRFDPAVGPIEVDLGTIDEGKYVSRKHARITCEDGNWKIEDLASSNGTYVLRNDFERVDEAELTDGCEIAFGNARFAFYLGAATSGQGAEVHTTSEDLEPASQENQ